MRTYQLTIAGLSRELPIIPLNEELSIASFVLLGDTELASTGAKALAQMIQSDFDYFVTAEAKGIPLVQCIAQEFKVLCCKKIHKSLYERPSLHNS